MRRLILLLLALVPFALHAQEADSDTADTASKMAGRTVTLSDFGAEDLGYLSLPPTPPSLGIVLVPDSFGLDVFTRKEADRLAALGYVVLAVDIYNGHTPTDPGDMANMSANLNGESVMKTVGAGIRLFHESKKFHVDHVIVMGWGVGASYAVQAARDDKTIDGAISFYGPVDTNLPAITRFAVPLCAVYPSNSPATPKTSIEAFQQRMKEVGSDFEAWYIDAQPGWSNPLSKAYNPVEDKEAWKVVLPFIVRIGASPVKKEKTPSILDKAGDGFKNFFK